MPSQRPNLLGTIMLIVVLHIRLAPTSQDILHSVGYSILSTFITLSWTLSKNSSNRSGYSPKGVCTEPRLRGEPRTHLLSTTTGGKGNEGHWLLVRLYHSIVLKISWQSTLRFFSGLPYKEITQFHRKHTNHEHENEVRHYHYIICPWSTVRATSRWGSCRPIEPAHVCHPL